MPRIVVKCRYYRNASAANISGLMKYIATREGVEKLSKDQKALPATEHQKDLIGQIVDRSPSLQLSYEYKEYTKALTHGAASEFISSAVENNPKILNTEMYLKYMATRPRVEKTSSGHGLFSSEDSIDLEDEIKKLEAHKGNVYSVIVSLTREDAERLCYNTAGRWRDMVMAHLDEIAKEHNIERSSLRWYGAFHNESYHPHIHLLLYSTESKDHSYISKKGINSLRRVFGKEIFKDELHEIYDEQTAVRNKLTEKMRSRFRELVKDLMDGKLTGSCYEDNLLDLAHRLERCTGKKQYGYLPKSVKALVDEIVDDVSVNADIRELYDIWYKAKCSVFATYTDQPPEKLPMSEEKAFKAIRNALVYEAVRLGKELRYKQENSKQAVTRAALRFARSVARVFYDNYKQYDPDEDDIDRKLKREIAAVKNGQNIVM